MQMQPLTPQNAIVCIMHQHATTPKFALEVIYCNSIVNQNTLCSSIQHNLIVCSNIRHNLLVCSSRLQLNSTTIVHSGYTHNYTRKVSESNLLSADQWYQFAQFALAAYNSIVFLSMHYAVAYDTRSRLKSNSMPQCTLRLHPQLHRPESNLSSAISPFVFLGFSHFSVSVWGAKHISGQLTKQRLHPGHGIDILPMQEKITVLAKMKAEL